LTGISEVITKYSSFAAGEYSCNELILFQSRLSPQGATYTKLAEFALVENRGEVFGTKD